MTKQEKIIEAYGEHWEAVKDYVDENGWIDYNDYPIQITAEFKTYYPFPNQEGSLCRPLALLNIETNNGWTKIESESDLPKESGAYWIVFKNGQEILKENFDQNDVWLNAIWKTKVGHYQPITKPQPPLY